MRLNHYRGGQGEPLLLIHGIGSRWQMWEPVLDGLVAQRDVIAIDLPGFGASGMPSPSTPPGVDSLVSLVEEFLGELGVERPHTAGNSLGGLIVLEMAKRGSARSATALSPAGFAGQADTAAAHVLLRIAFRSAQWLAPRAETLLATRTARRLALSGFVARPADMSVNDAAGNLRGLANAGWFVHTLPTIRANDFSGGDQIAAPVTIAWGSKDRLLFPRQMKKAAREIPTARLVRLEGCGHVPTFDDPELVTRVLLEGSEPVV